MSVSPLTTSPYKIGLVDFEALLPTVTEESMTTILEYEEEALTLPPIRDYFVTTITAEAKSDLLAEEKQLLAGVQESLAATIDPTSGHHAYATMPLPTYAVPVPELMKYFANASLRVKSGIDSSPTLFWQSPSLADHMQIWASLSSAAGKGNASIELPLCNPEDIPEVDVEL
jgi:hypothetical protein